MSGDRIVQIVALMACLMLAWRNLRGQGVSAPTKLKMAVAWVCIIAALTLGIRILAPAGGI